MTRFRLCILLLTLLLLPPGTSCSDVRLQRAEQEASQEFDNLLEIEGRFCTEPAGEITFPVKVLFVLDQSASLQCLDSRQLRFEALNATIADLRRQPSAQFAFIGFANWFRQQGFTRSLDDIAPFLDPGQGLGPATDYQGALTGTLRMLERDILDTDPVERARTRYIIQFVSDGVPEPRCTLGCDSSQPPDSLYGVCNTTRDIPDDVYIDHTPCQPYNQPEQIIRRVEEIIALKDIYGVGSIVMNTVLLFSPQNVVESVCPGASEQFGYDRMDATRILRVMAEAGGGVFRDINLEQRDVDYLRIDVSSIQAEYVMSNIFAFNQNARRTERGLEPDSDGDGLVDSKEAELGTDPYRRDTDGDGYSDFFEYKLRQEGFDPRNPNAPAIICSDDRDRDGDGLAVCEEEYLGTNPLNPDTDGDGVPDGIEFLLGTDPLIDDMAMDNDFDGVLNIDEIRGGSNVLIPDEEIFRRERMVYQVEDLGNLMVDGRERRCYDFRVRRVPMARTTLPTEPGRNRILIYTRERLAEFGGTTGITKAACFEGVYNGPRMKNPASGRIDVSQAAMERVHDSYYERLFNLSMCPLFGFDNPEDPLEGDDLEFPDRDDIQFAISSCMPPRMQIADQLLTRAQVYELMERHIDTQARLRVPEESYRLFRPLSELNYSRDCFRPWELERFLEFLDDLHEACMQCE